MKKIYSYILKLFIKNLLIVQLAIAVLSLITSVLGELKNISGYEYSLFQFIKIQLCWLVINNNLSMPITTTLASIITILQLMRTNEILAFLSLGGRLISIAIPLLTVGTGVVLFMLGIDFYGVPNARIIRGHIVDAIQNVDTTRAPGYANIWLMDSKNKLVYIELIDLLNQNMRGLKFYNITDNYSIDNYLQIDNVTKEGDKYFTEGNVYVDLVTNPPKFYDRKDRYITSNLFDELFEIESDYTKGLSPIQIYNIMKIMERRGLSVDGYKMLLYSKLANILSVIILMILTFPIVINFSRNYSIIKNIALALVVGLVFWIVQSAFLSFGNSGVLSPAVSNFFPLIFFMGISVAIIIYRRKAR